MADKAIEVLNTYHTPMFARLSDKQQEQLRANLTTLQPTGQEAALRNRMLGQLESSQDRLEAIEVEVNKLNQLIADSEKKIDEIVAGLG